MNDVDVNNLEVVDVLQVISDGLFCHFLLGLTDDKVASCTQPGYLVTKVTGHRELTFIEDINLGISVNKISAPEER